MVNLILINSNLSLYRYICTGQHGKDWLTSKFFGRKMLLHTNNVPLTESRVQE